MLGFEELAAAVVDFMQRHAAWCLPLTFAVALAESLAVVSLFVPATIILVGIGALAASGVASFWDVFAAAVAGSILGNAISYWIGQRFKESVARSWFFRARPELLRHGHRFFGKHGGKSVFIGRFFGPTRAVIPLIAGMAEMPRRRFLVANATSAVLWVLLSIAPGLMGGLALPGLPAAPATAAPAPSAPALAVPTSQ